jgi:tetratricopeptide (TPR) repeat protein
MTGRWSVAIACTLVAARPAFADSKAEVKAHLERAAAAHKAGRFNEALDELTSAYAIDPRPTLLFSIGQVHMKLGDCDTAITFYRRFLDSHPDPREAGIVSQAISTCKDHAGARPSPREPVKPAPPPPPVEPPSPAPEEPPPTPVEPPPQLAPQAAVHRAPWYRDWLGDALVVAGATCGAIAIVEYRAAVDDREQADRAGTYGNFEDLLDSAHRERTLALGFGAGAGLLVVTGVLHYIIGSRSTEGVVALVPTSGGQVLAWRASF